MRTLAKPRTIRATAVLAVTFLLLAAMVEPASARRLAESPVGGAPLSAELDGEQEVDGDGNPGVGDPDATGFAVTTINPGQGIACYELEHDVDPAPWGFHIHVGEAGVNGPIVVNFFTDPTGVVPPNGCVEIERGLATDILRNPEGYYFNLHNAEFPAGAIRGQLSISSR
jgi:hypothetical protein